MRRQEFQKFMAHLLPPVLDLIVALDFSLVIMFLSYWIWLEPGAKVKSETDTNALGISALDLVTHFSFV